jgi:hypothetical protein
MYCDYKLTLEMPGGNINRVGETKYASDHKRTTAGVSQNLAPAKNFG